jgi:amino acid transporter
MAAGRRRGGTLGTFAGVFTPSVLTILGLILFRRLGYVVGGAGLAQALAILALAHAISILTSMSLSAIATNIQVRGGGDYYLISRSLGVEFGGALGVVLFLAQSLSVAFYLLGFGEALAALWPGTVSASLLAAAATVFLFVFAWLGSDWATRLQYVVMAALGLALASFFLGGLERFSGETLAASAAAGGAPGFWVLFALFFPAVTGFTQGVSMSGDLEDPGRSLPLGTFAAVGVSLVVYLAAALVFAGSLPPDVLVEDYDAMARVARWPALITVGIVAATLSSALASFLGAPRILQALAADRVFAPLQPFAKGYGPSRNPRRGVALTLVIALGFIALGGIDFLAPIVSMFFLISYGLLNYATAFEAKAASPSFRPRFKWFHYRVSLVGAAACLGTMLMISPIASAVAVAVLFALYQYVDRLAPPDRWADSRRDHYFQNVRRNLWAMAREAVHPRNWRPHLLVFSDTPDRRERLVRFASWLEGGAGVTTVVQVLPGTGDRSAQAVDEARETLAKDLADRELDAFALVVAAPHLTEGVQTLIQSYGVGPLKANTILLNWLEHRHAAERHSGARLFVEHLRAAQRLGVNVIVLDAKDRPAELRRREPGRIDVWWLGGSTSRLMLLLAYLMTRSEDWSETPIRLIARADEHVEDLKAKLQETLDEFRIDADIELVDRLDSARFVQHAADASLVFLPLRLSKDRAVDPFRDSVVPLLDALPATALVSAAEDIELDATPEEIDAPPDGMDAPPEELDSTPKET